MAAYWQAHLDLLGPDPPFDPGAPTKDSPDQISVSGSPARPARPRVRLSRASDHGRAGAPGYRGRSSSISVTSAAMAERSDRVSVTWANSG